MVGRRRPDGTGPSDLEPGDYCRRLVNVGHNAPWWRWFVRCPDGGLTPLAHEHWPDASGRHHVVVTHDDGSISVMRSPENPNSIRSPAGWHGWIDHGTWTETG